MVGRVGNKELIAITDHGFAIKGSGVYTTLDGGRTWTGVDLSSLVWLSQVRDLIFIDDKVGLISVYDQIVRTEDGGVTWKKTEKPTGDFYKIRFVNATTGFAIGYGTFIKTTDAGKTWQHVNTSGGTITGIAAYNNKLYTTSMVSTYSSRSTGRNLAVSSDGGTGWQSLQHVSDADFTMVSFITPQTGFVSSDYQNYKTTDGGASWKGLNWTNRIHEPVMLGDGTMVISDGLSIYRSTDGGETLTEVFESPSTWPDYKPVGKLIKLDDQNLISYNGYHLYKSTDAGVTWNYITTEDNTPPTQDMFFISPLVGYSLELFGAIYKTMDGGTTWTKIFTPEPLSSRVYNTIFFVDSQVGFKAAETLSKTTDGGLTWTTLFTNFNTNILRLHFTDAQHEEAPCSKPLMAELHGNNITSRQMMRSTMSISGMKQFTSQENTGTSHDIRLAEQHR
jgi:photosystem II stability/assembly factor-like uncharacterized protein